MKKLKLPKFHWAKLLSIFFFVILLASYIKIFAIASPYSPGEILDPECAPGEENCIVLISGGGSSPWLTSGSDIYYNDGNVGIGTDSPASLLDIKIGTTLSYEQTFSENDGMGDSLDDATYSGTYIGSVIPDIIYVVIDSTGSSDTFSYYDNTYYYSGDVGGDCPYTANVPITGSPQLLCGGISITFDSTTGHGLYDRWTYEINNHVTSTNPVFKISDGANNYFSINAVAPDSIFLGTDAGIGATNASNSNFLGYQAGYQAEGANYSNFLGYQAGNGSNSTYSNFLGYQAGNGSNSTYSNFLGPSAGFQATNAASSNFLGYGAGDSATDAHDSNFLGYGAGDSASNAYQSNFLGSQAGVFATNAYNSNFLGPNAGYQATNASSSNFFGTGAGDRATNASNSIFVGYYAGYGDTVNNTINNNDWSILIGYRTKTGGNKNSVLIGGNSDDASYVSNTKANQFMLAPTLTEMRLRGVDYTLPSSQGGASTVLTNDGSGGLTWGTVSGGGGLTSDADLNTKGGTSAGLNLVSGAQYNTFLGYEAGKSSATLSTNAADENTAIGYQSLFSNTTGDSNTANGSFSLYSNTTGSLNTANGYQSLYSNTTGSQNTANGNYSLYSNTTGSQNTANGYRSLFSNTTGYENTAISDYSLYSNTTGTYNIGLGYDAGDYISGGVIDNTTGDYNVFLGSNTKALADNDQNEIVIGYDTTGNGSDTTTIGNTSTLRTYLTGLNLKAGTATAGTAPLKFTSSAGALLSITEAGAVEYDGSHLYFTAVSSGPRYQLDQQGGGSNFATGDLTFTGNRTHYLGNYSYDIHTGPGGALDGSYDTFGEEYAERYVGGLSNQSSGILQYGGTNNAEIWLYTYDDDLGLASDLVLRSDSFTSDIETTVTNGVYSSLRNLLYAIGPGSITNGFGSSMDFYLGGLVGGVVNTDELASQLITKFTDVTLNAEDSQFSIRLVNNGSVADKFTLNSTGQLQLNTYGSGTHTGTATKWLAVDASGNMIEQNAPSGGGLSSDADYNTKGGTDAGLNLFAGAQYNTFLGYEAGKSGAGTTNAADYNTGIGYQSLSSNTTGAQNTANGYQSLYSNTIGNANVANGYFSLFSNTTGGGNTANGYQSLRSNTIGTQNTANGYFSLFSNTTGGGNTANGYQSLRSNKANNRSTAIGYNSMYYADDRTSGQDTYNTAVGYEALKGSATAANNTGQYNTAIGDSALYSNTTGSLNTANGYGALFSNTSGSQNISNGERSLYSNTTGVDNTANGYYSLYRNTTGAYNTANGAGSLDFNTTGANNIGLGYNAGSYISDGATGNLTGSNSLFLGAETKAQADAQTNQIVIGYNATGNGSDTATIGNTSTLRTYLTGLNLKAGTATAGTAPLKFTSSAGTLLGTTEAGAVEFDGSHLYFTAVSSGPRYQLDQQSTGGSMVYPASGIAVSNGSGWGTPITDNSTNWNNALPSSSFTDAGVTGKVLTGYVSSSGTILSTDTILEAIQKLNGNIVGGGSGSVTSVSVTTANGVSGSVLNSTTTPAITLTLGAITPTSVNNLPLSQDNTDLNVKVGQNAGLNLAVSAQRNTFLGYEAGKSGATGGTNDADYNTAIGYQSLFSNTTGYWNTSTGSQSLFSNTTGDSNTANGSYSLYSNTTGYSNTANGSQSLYYNTTGNYNTANGYGSLYRNTTGSRNTTNGANSLDSNITGIFNIGLGYSAGSYISSGTYTPNTTGDYNIFLGSDTKALADDDQNEIVIGYNTTGKGSNTTTIGNTSTLRTYLTGLNLKAGSATAGTAPLKFTSSAGALLGTTEAGAVEYDGSHLYFTATNNGTRFQLDQQGGGGGLTSDADFNTKGGTDAGLNLASGAQANTFLGYEAGKSDAASGTNAADNNTAIGYRSLYSNTTGSSNIALGYYSLYSNTTGTSNAALGLQALYSNTTGSSNIALGIQSLFLNTSGNLNTALGNASLSLNTTGYNNIALGDHSLYSNTTGYNNTALGNGSLYSNTTGRENVSLGDGSLYSNTTGIQNTSLGLDSLQSNTTGYRNTSLGFYSLVSNITGMYNVGMGYEAGRYISGGATANTTGDYNIFIGTQTKALADNDQNEIVIGYNATGNGSDTVTIGNTGTLRTYLTGLNLKAGSATAGTAPLKFTSSAGTLLGTTEGGAVEYDGTHLYFTAVSSGPRYQLDQQTGGGGSMVYPSSGIAVSTGSAWGTPITDNSTNWNNALPSSSFTDAGVTSKLLTGYVSGSGTILSTDTILEAIQKLNGNLVVSGSGSVTSVSVTTANGVSGSVANATTTPAITLTLGAITPTSVNGLPLSQNDTDFNVKVGQDAGLNLFSGAQYNTFLGYEAGKGGVVTNAADKNTAIGYRSLYSNTTGMQNTANGSDSLSSNTTGNSNTANGSSSLSSNTTGYFNTANGFQSLYSNTTGNFNTANGYQSLFSNTTGSDNTANGTSSLFSNTTGSDNIANGTSSLSSNTTGYSNTANGFASLYSNTGGNYNTANGFESLHYNTTGASNTGLGYNAGSSISSNAANTTGDFNIFLGSSTKALADNDQNEIVIGYNTTGHGSDTATIGTGNVLYVGGGSVTGMVARFTNGTGSCDINPTTASIGCSSDIRLKKNITTLDGQDFILNTEIKNTKIDEATLEETNKTVLEKLISLNPVKYNWNIEDYQVDENGNDNKHIGFIAQEMEQIFPDLVATDEKTGLKSIFYTNLIPYTIEAIEEMDLKVKDLSSLDVTKATSLGYLIKSFLVDQSVLIRELTVNKLNIDGEVCVDDTCITKEQFKQMIITAGGVEDSGNTNTKTPPIVIPPVIIPPTNNPAQALTSEEIEAQRLADLETERLANEKATADRLETERLEKEAEDKAIADKAEADRIEAERIAAEKEATELEAQNKAVEGTE